MTKIEREIFEDVIKAFSEEEKWIAFHILLEWYKETKEGDNNE